MAFAKHNKSFKGNREKVNKWRKALKDVADFSGWHVTQEKSEREVIEEITKQVSEAVGRLRRSDSEKQLIGMDSRIEQVKSRLHLWSHEILTIGIWGMGGIGKSTLAKEVFYEIRDQFHPSGLVPEVRLKSELQFLTDLCKSFPGHGDINFDTVERGIKLLQKVLRKSKVLIVLDDVDDFKQIKCLEPGERLGLDTWGGGSRLIITSRDRSVWRYFGVPENQIYEVEKLNDEEAYQLLCQKAFKKDNPPYEFVALSKSFLQYAGGIPLAHEVLGAHLRGQDVDAWSEILHRLDDDKDKDIFSVLQISFDGLQDTDKKIFLDIACFFNGEDQVRVKRILEGCGFSVKIGIRNLINKSLIKIESNNELWMHDLLRCLGWHIVREESPNEPGKRSRLWVDDNAHKYESRRSWRFEDALDVLKDNTEHPAVEGLFLSLPERREMCLNKNEHPNPDRFSIMDNDLFRTPPSTYTNRRLREEEVMPFSNLRLLKIYNVNFQYVQFTSLSEKLRLLEWHECPLESLPSNFKSDRLVEFKMPNSRIKRLWNETPFMRMLILMDLSNCQYLAMTPDFSKVPKLERLILEGCKELSKVHPTIGGLQHLVLLNLKGCTSLESLSSSISLRSLRTFILSGCSKFEEFPEIVGSMENLSELYLDGTAIRELPVSIQHLRGLILLNLSGCKNLLYLPRFFCSSLTSLKFLYLSLCSSIEKLPENIGCLKHLEELDACDTSVRKVPESISDLKNLKLLCFHGCSRYTSLELPNLFSGLRSLTTLNLGGCNLAEGAIPDDIGKLFSLQSLDLSENNFFTIPESISQLSELTEISLFRCSKLQSLPKEVPLSLKNVDVRYCPMLTNSLYGWSRWASQMGLSTLNCRKPEEYLSILPALHKFPLQELQELNLSNCQHLTKIPDLNEVRYLKKLILEGCEKLSEVHPTIWDLRYLVLLNLKGCVDLKSLPRSICLKSLEVFILSGCSKLEVFPEIKGDMKNLSQLHLDGTALRDLPISMQQLKGLVLLNLRGCRNLTTIPNLLSLTSLNLSGCLRISKLLDNLGMLAKLQELDASETVIRYVHRSISLLKNLEVLSFGGCKGLQLPNWFSDLRSLTSLNLRRCGLTEEVLDLLCCLSSLQILDLSTNNFASIPNEIDRLSSLHLLDLSENNFVSIPESISQLSELTELRLFRCSKLQSLPRNLPFNLKHVDARECPMLKNNADTLTILASGKRFCFINCGQADQDKDHPSNVPVPKEGREVLFHKYIEDRVYGEKPFEVRFPHSRSSPHLWSRWTSGPSVTIPLADSYRFWIGFALFVVFEILQKDDFDESWELEETICDFYTHSGRHENSLVFQNFINFRNGSTYGLCCYEPRGGQFGGLSPLLRASVSTKRPDLIVRACGIHLITQQDAAEFVQNLTYQTVTQHLDFNFSRHCEEILYETMTGDRMELGSTSIVNEDSCSESNSNIQPRGDLPILYEGRNGRKKCFYFCFPAPVISITPWFFNHHAGDVTVCQITENSDYESTENLLDDRTWVGVELCVLFTRLLCTLNVNNSFFFHVDLCTHDHERIIMHGSLKINSCLGNLDQLVVLHVPRVHFKRKLKKCQVISALFRTIEPEMEVQVCGSRIVFEQDLKALMDSLTEAAGQDPPPIAQIVDQRNAVEGERPINCNSSFQRLNQFLSSCRKKICFLDQRNAVEELPINCNSWFQRSTAQAPLPERAPSSSIMRLRKYYSCYLQQNQGVQILN
ncbi:hypothetical protein M0R45_004550 [Rubus argutus]|uniref:TMV resistance protein N-like n=1 Tax=Rubus argutus TaxID=59490 RepID=A0AAW1YK66_RUBAR